MNAPERFTDEPASPFLTPEHLAFRDMLRRFVTTEIEPFAAQWDEAGEFPRELYLKAASIGLLQLGFPEEYGGAGQDLVAAIAVIEELQRARDRGEIPAEVDVMLNGMSFLAGLYALLITLPSAADVRGPMLDEYLTTYTYGLRVIE